MKKLKKILISVALVLALCFGGFGIYAMDYYHAEETAVNAVVSEDIQVYSQGDMMVFEPKNPTTGFIFYPGGKVEHIAYSLLMKQLADNGILCVIVKMPFNLAVLNINGAKEVLQQFDSVDSWYIGGHSLGGSMAASFAVENTDVIDGLIMLAAYSTVDLKQTDLKVLSVYGDADGVLNMEKYGQYYPNLPHTMTEVIINGGNHAQFGSYGAQDGDGIATISADKQIKQTVNAIIDSIK